MTQIAPIIVPGYAAVFVFIFVLLAARVIWMRQTRRVAIGTGGHVDLERALRVHANFSEYVPFAILLIAFLEMQNQPRWLIHALAIGLLLGRITHICGVSRQDEDFRFRRIGMFFTFMVMIVAAVRLLTSALWAGA